MWGFSFFCKSINLDFSEETIIFTKMEALLQSGAFALSRTDALTHAFLICFRGDPTTITQAALAFFKENTKQYCPALTVTQTQKGLTC